MMANVKLTIEIKHSAKSRIIMMCARIAIWLGDDDVARWARRTTSAMKYRVGSGKWKRWPAAS